MYSTFYKLINVKIYRQWSKISIILVGLFLWFLALIDTWHLNTDLLISFDRNHIPTSFFQIRIELELIFLFRTCGFWPLLFTPSPSISPYKFSPFLLYLLLFVKQTIPKINLKISKIHAYPSRFRLHSLSLLLPLCRSKTGMNIFCKISVYVSLYFVLILVFLLYFFYFKIMFPIVILANKNYSA